MFIPHEEGQSLVEYAVVIVLIVILGGSALCALVGAIVDFFDLASYWG